MRNDHRTGMLGFGLLLVLLLLLTVGLLNGWQFTSSRGEVASYGPLSRVRLAYGAAEINSTTHLHQRERRRQSELTQLDSSATSASDYVAINKLLDGIRVNLPDSNVSNGGYTIYVRNLQCTNVFIDDVSTGYSVALNRRALLLTTSIVWSATVCQADFTWKYSIFKGAGNFYAYTGTNQVEMDWNFTTKPGQSYNDSPPASVNVQACRAATQVTRVDIFGDVLTSLLGLFQGSITSTVEDEADNALCSKVMSLNSNLLNGLKQTNGKLSNLLRPLPTSLGDPLYMENNLVVPPGVELINWKQQDPLPTGATGWLMQALRTADETLGQLVADPTGPRGSNGTDLNVNVLLRSKILDANRALVVDIDRSGTTLPIFAFNDSAVYANIRINSIAIQGLDTLTSFPRFTTLGKRTLQKNVSWDFLQISLALSADLSVNLGDTVQTYRPLRVAMDNLTLSIRVNKVSTAAALLMAVNRNKLESMPLSAFLRPDHILSCVLSSIVHSLDLASLVTNLGSIGELSLSGFLNRGIDRLMRTVLESALVMYNVSLLLLGPVLSQINLRDWFNNNFLRRLLSLGCPPLDPALLAGFVDFRELLLPPADSLSHGGAGQVPFGPVGYLAFAVVQRLLQTPNRQGALGINDLIAKITEKKYGQTGLFEADPAPGNTAGFHSFQIPGLAKVVLTLSSLLVHNLNTVVSPLSFALPTNSANVLASNINFHGLGARAVKTSVAISIDTVSNSSSSVPYSHDVLQIVVLWNTFHVLADLAIQMYTSRLLAFPLGLILNLNCWLTTLSNSPAAVGLFLNKSLIDWGFSNLEVNCMSCSSPGLSVISSILNAFTSAGSTTLLIAKLLDVTNGFIAGPWLQSVINLLILDAPKFCPFRPEYQSKGANRTNIIRALGFPNMTDFSIDTLVYSMSLTAFAVATIVVENRKILNVAPTYPLSGQNKLNVPPRIRLVDWTNLGNSTGLGSGIEYAFRAGNSYLSSPTAAGELGIVSIAKTWFGTDGVLLVDIPRVGSNTSAFSVTGNLKLGGLTSVTRFDGFRSIAPQTLSTIVQWAYLNVTMRLSLVYPHGVRNYSFAIRLDGVQADLAFLAALDADRLAGIPLGSLLHQANILPCMLSTAFALGIPYTNVTVVSISQPNFSGFKPDTTLALTKAWAALSRLFGRDFRQVVPNLIPEALTRAWALYARVWKCPAAPPAGPNDVIDFRDFLLDPQSSRNQGGRGGEPYGDVIHPIVSRIRRLLHEPGKSGWPKINDLIIDPLTTWQSGKPGELYFASINISRILELGDAATSTRFPDLLLTTATGLLSRRYTVLVEDLRVQGLNTVVNPFGLVTPISSSPNVLENLATWDGVARQQRLSVSGRLSVTKNRRIITHTASRSSSSSSSSSSRNGGVFSSAAKADATFLDHWVWVASADFVQVDTRIRIPILARALLQLPLGQVARRDCWWALIQSSAGGTTNNASEAHGLALISSNSTLVKTKFEHDYCRNCSADGWAWATEWDRLWTPLTTRLRDELAERLLDALLTSRIWSQRWSQKVAQSKLSCPL